MILIPNGTDLAVIVEAYGFLSHNQVSFIAIYEKSGSNASLLRPHPVARAGQEVDYGFFEFHQVDGYRIQITPAISAAGMARTMPIKPPLIWNQ